MSNIAVIGAGYVGLVTGLGFAQLGHNIHFIDLDKNRISKLKNGEVPFFESGLDKIISHKEINERVTFSSDYSDELKEADIVFICVQTPEGDNEKPNLEFLYGALNSIRKSFGKDITICIKSTIPPTVLNELEDQLDDVNSLVFNPEFLREGNAMYDFMYPDRIVIGGSNESSINIITNLYKDFDTEIILTDAVTALLIKYLSNAYLPMRISFVNEALEMGDALNANIPTLIDGIGADKRIGKDYFRPSPGWGGSCFPKDTKSLKSMLNDIGLPSPLITSINVSNDKHLEWTAKKVLDINTSLSKSKIILYGAAFKENTDDMRDSPTVTLYEKLKEEDVEVLIYDEFKMGLIDSIADYEKIEDSLVIIMYPLSKIESIIEELQSKNNSIYIPWENKVL